MIQTHSDVDEMRAFFAAKSRRRIKSGDPHVQAAHAGVRGARNCATMRASGNASGRVMWCRSEAAKPAGGAAVSSSTQALL